MKTYLHNIYHLDIAFVAFVLSLVIFKLIPTNSKLKPKEEIQMSLFVGLIASIAIYITEI